MFHVKHLRLLMINTIQGAIDAYESYTTKYDLNYAFLKQKVRKYGYLGGFEYKIYLMREDSNTFKIHEYNLADESVGKLVCEGLKRDAALAIATNPEHVVSQDLYNMLKARAEAKKLIGIEDGI